VKVDRRPAARPRAIRAGAASFFADKILLAESTCFTPSGHGPSRSARGSGVCGDAVCTATEDCSTCASDCGVCTTCGNSICETGQLRDHAKLIKPGDHVGSIVWRRRRLWRAKSLTRAARRYPEQ
jgi:hypothetical protein